MIEQPDESMSKSEAGGARLTKRRRRRRRQAATAALGVLTLTSGVAVALDAITPISPSSSPISAGRLTISLAARDGFKLDSCTSATNEPTDSRTTNSTQSDTTAAPTDDFSGADRVAEAAHIDNGGTGLPTVPEYRPTIDRAPDYYDYDDSSDDETGFVTPVEILSAPADNFHQVPATELREDLAMDNRINGDRTLDNQAFEARFNELPIYRPLNNLPLNPNSYIHIAERGGYVHVDDLTQLMRDAQDAETVSQPVAGRNPNNDLIVNGFKVDPVFADYLRTMQLEDPVELLTQFSNRTLPIPESHEFIYWSGGEDEGP
ncbi:hypothetical protein [Mycobacterium attenuatum]|uniref:hypothetical protein n=1 Tax=Mycobacterium attenuatum TaxID=2341086 RepID=UPI000F030C0D|nr:hypothetical protein [Mycobacterium attenuatum]VBA58491.1 hypothetical protein LAUMK41_03003 [Mycobacterium attenuatum]